MDRSGQPGSRPLIRSLVLTDLRSPGGSHTRLSCRCCAQPVHAYLWRVSQISAGLFSNRMLTQARRVYADLDMECLRSSDTLFETYNQPGRQAFLGRMGSDDSSSASLPNAWFASTPGHPFWVLPLEYVESKIDENLTAEGLSGPGALHNVVEEYRDTYAGDEMDRHYAQSGWRNLFPQPDPILSDTDDQTVTILPQWEIYPYSWLPIASPYSHFCWTRAELFDEMMCKLLLGTEEQGSHAITYWSHTWGDDGGGHDTKGWKSISEKES